jgi:dipeptidyl aminopeptidase/acylaminoacyl peptidase
MTRLQAMKNIFSILVSLFTFLVSLSQKKPLDHSVYDGWQRIGERMISNDGKWVVYTICPQVGDTTLVIQSSDGQYKKEIEHSKNALITEDSRFVIFKIRPLYKDLRESWIKKKKTDEMPKDSLGIVELGKEEVWKQANVRSYKTPAKSAGWLAYEMEKGKDGGEADVILRKLSDGSEKTFRNVKEYHFNKTGRKLLLYSPKHPKDSLGKSYVLLYDLRIGVMDTLSRGGNDFKNFVMSDDGLQVAYVAERDAGPKDLQKFYKLWYYKQGKDSAELLVNKNSSGMHIGMTVSEFGQLSFSKSGKRLFFGTTPIQPPKDTTLIEIDLVKLDIWHYNDDYLQTVQTLPNRLRAALQENFLTVYDLEAGTIKQLGSREIPQVLQTNEGDGDIFIGVTDFGKRIESQWLGTTRKDIYAMDVKTGSKTLVKQNLHGQVYPSSTGKYIMWFDRVAKHYFAWDARPDDTVGRGKTARNISSAIKVPLWNEDSQTPDDPGPYGVMGWHEGDSAVYVYDRYDVWKVNPMKSSEVINVTINGRKNSMSYRYIRLDTEELFLKSNKHAYFRVHHLPDKQNGIYFKYELDKMEPPIANLPLGPYIYNYYAKAKTANRYIFSKENFNLSPGLYAIYYPNIPLALINPQQKDYLWGTAELFKWKAYNGKEATGIVYKPENFDPKKKYPMIVYFYEKLSQGLHEYTAPAPVRSAINVSYFVSNGYIIFMPDIHYTTGHPGKNAYDYIVSGARALVGKGWVDSTKMALQGHSWGGYQAAQLATMTKLFKAVWAGAPVANMTSAYGGIRWESGLSRQWQYEKSQSRIGASLWEKPQLYIENSPLFHLHKVTAPMVIMHNDADGAVPWYQGIELFTGLRRLGKKVWMLNYNDQGHGLTQRKDQLDYHIRMQQFFDWILKGEKPAKWITEGVPAVKKGKDWGLEVE